MVIFRLRGSHVNLFVQIKVDPCCTPSTEEMLPRGEPAARTLQAVGVVTFPRRRLEHSLPLLILEY